MAMQAGPKGKRDPSPLPFNVADYPTVADAFVAFCREYIVTPKGRGARDPFEVRPWQRDIVASVLDPAVRMSLVVIPRGNGKSALTAALALFHIMCLDIEGARAVVVAQDERSALRLIATAARMVELSEPLSSRLWVYRDRITCPATDSAIVGLPAEAARIEGEDASLAIMDEIGYCRRDSYEALLHSTGKRDESSMLMIGTPSVPSWREASPMLDLVLEGRSGGSTDFALVEFTSDITHPATCEHCWEAANPGLDDLVTRDALRSALPPRSRESEYRRARLGQWVDQDDASFLPPGLWDKLATGDTIPAGADVIVALDGSFNADGTALLLATVSASPHFEVLGLWEPPKGDDTYRVPIVEVEDTIRSAAKRYNVVEVVADPFRWARSLQLLEADGLTVVEFNQNPRRLTPATTDLHQSALAGELSHSGDARLARHVSNATVVEDANGVRLAKEKRNSSRRIDLAACLVMAHSRATWRATRKPKRRRTASFSR